MTVGRPRKKLQRSDQMRIGLEPEPELSHSWLCRKVTTHLKQLKQMDGAHEAGQLHTPQLGSCRWAD